MRGVLRALIVLFHLLSLCFFFSSRRRHTRCLSDWSSDVCSSDLGTAEQWDNAVRLGPLLRSPAEARRQEFAEQLLPLRSAATVVVHDPAVVEDRKSVV